MSDDDVPRGAAAPSASSTASDGEKRILYECETSAPVRGADYVFWCPGCGHGHGVWTRGENSAGAKWTFNGDMERPTFEPSIKVLRTGADGREETKCHLYVKDGRLQFLGDCQHEYAGKTVPMVPF